MKKDEQVTVTQLLQNMDRAEAVEWLKEHCQDATKILIVCGTPNGQGGLELSATQIGFQYVYELEGFADLVATFFSDYETVDDGEADAQ